MGRTGRGVRIRLEVYLPFRGQRRWSGEEEIPPGMTVGQLPSHLGIREPDLAVLVGGRYAQTSQLLRDGDQVAVLRQAEGG